MMMRKNRIILRELGGIRGGPAEETSFSVNLEECLAAKTQALWKDDRARAGHASRGAAECYRRLGRLNDATVEYGQSIELLQTTADVSGLAWSLFALGNLRRQQSDFRGARRVQRRALTMARFCGDSGLIAYALAGLAETTRILGDYPTAYCEHLSAWRYFRALGDLRGTVWALEGIGQILKNVGNVSGALRHFAKAKSIASAANDLRGLGYALKCHGECLAELGELQAAVADVFMAVQLFESIQLKVGLGYAQKALGDIFLCAGNDTSALGWYNQAKSTFLSCEDARGVAYVVNGIGRACLAKGDFEGSAIALAHSGSYFRTTRIQLGATQVATASRGIQLATSVKRSSMLAELVRPDTDPTTLPTGEFADAALLLASKSATSKMCWKEVPPRPRR